jgi:hypothetical protein
MVEAMEFEQPLVVTLDGLTRLAIATGAAEDEAGAARLAYRLRELGWLGGLRTRRAWEFIPGSRAGAIGSGDRLIEFRAHLAVHPDWPGALAMESAASLLGWAQRPPDREIVALPPGWRLPKALSDWRMVTVATPAAGLVRRDHLPTWNLEGLIAGISSRPSGYQDLPDLAQWLPQVGPKLRGDDLLACLAAAPESAWQRAAYLARVAGAADVASALVAERPPRHPIWFSTRRGGGVHDPLAKVTDADLAPYMTGGTGA